MSKLVYMSGDSDGFVKPKKIRRRNTETSSVASSVNSENVFSDLQEDFGNAPENQKQQKQLQTDTTDVPRKVKLPPLVAVNVSYHKLQPLVDKLGVRPAYKITGIGTKILCQSEGEFQMVENLLKQLQVEFFTHDKPGERPFKAIIRGLPGVTTQSLKRQLQEEHQLNPLEVIEVKRNDKYKDTMYLVHFPRGSTTLRQLKQIRFISNIHVSWAPYRSKQVVTMCMNCLHFGHGTRHCHRISRCNRCGAQHETKACKAAETTEPQCANCAGKHPATDKSCVKRAEFLKIRQQATTSHQPGRKRFNNPMDNYEANFPPIRGNQPVFSTQTPKSHPPGFQQHPNEPTPPKSAWHSEASPSLYTPTELTKIFNEMASSLRGCRTKFEQIQVLGNFVIQYGY